MTNQRSAENPRWRRRRSLHRLAAPIVVTLGATTAACSTGGSDDIMMNPAVPETDTTVGPDHLTDDEMFEKWGSVNPEEPW